MSPRPRDPSFGLASGSGSTRMSVMPPSSRIRRSGLESVLHVLRGLLEFRAALVGLALGLQPLVVGGLAAAFLDLAADLFGLVVNLVVERHDRPPLRREPTPSEYPIRSRAT